jgi:rhodanese-related sulfurtransferase
MDVREDHEWEKGHATEAVHLGKGILERDLEKMVPDPNTELIMYCGGGYRSVLTADAAQKLGYRNVYSLIGGYKALKEIATTFQIGMQITLDRADDTGYFLGFRSYKGLDRSSLQTENPVVRFSPHMDSLTDIKELQSIAALKTLVYAFAPGLNPGEGEPELRTVPGVSSLPGPGYTGFDLRAQLVFADDITTDKVDGNPATVVEILNSRAYDALLQILY